MRNHLKWKYCFSLCALAVLALPSSAGASILYSNLASPNSLSSVSLSSTAWAANGFTTDGNVYTMSDVIVALEGVARGGSVTVSLYNKVGSAPGSSLATVGAIADSALSTSSFTQQQVNTNILLSPNTSYFIVLSGSSAAGVDALWERENGFSGTGVAGQIWATSADGGSTWSPHLVSSDFQPLLMQVDVLATPEPGTVFGALGGLALILMGRRRRAG